VVKVEKVAFRFFSRLSSTPTSKLCSIAPVELAVQVGDRRDRGGRVPAGLGAALHPPDAVDHELGRAAVAGVGDDVVVEGLGIADHLADAEVFADLVVEDTVAMSALVFW
jgi:hypothetical protein